MKIAIIKTYEYDSELFEFIERNSNSGIVWMDVSSEERKMLEKYLKKKSTAFERYIIIEQCFDNKETLEKLCIEAYKFEEKEKERKARERKRRETKKTEKMRMADSRIDPNEVLYDFIYRRNGK